MSRINRSVMWEYFQKLDNVSKRAKCRTCFEVYSYKSTTGNLKNHLKKKHPNHFKKVISVQLAEKNTSINTKRAEQQESSSDQPSTANSTRAFTQKRKNIGTGKSANSIDVWSYYKVCGSRMECLACDATVPRCEADAREHLKENHAKLMAEDFIETEWDEPGDVGSLRSHKPDSDSDDNNQDAAEQNVFTEVFYVNDNPLNVDDGELKKEKVPSRRKTERKHPRHRKISEEICYDTSDEEPEEVRHKSKMASKLTKNKQNDEALNTFSVYMLSLMRSLPNDVCTKLQMDIINLIMAEKLKHALPNQEINRPIPASVPVSLPVSVVDPGSLTLRAIPGTSGVTASYVVVTSTDTGNNVQEV